MDVSRHQHSPSIALIEEDSTERKLPIEECFSPESLTLEKSHGNTSLWDKAKRWSWLILLAFLM